MTHRSTTMSDAVDGIVNAAKSNPEGLLLLAAGVALMLRSGRQSQGSGRSGARQSQAASRGRAPSGGAGQGRDRGGDGLMSAAGDYVSDAGDYVSDVADKVSSAAGRYAGAAGDYASNAGRSAAQQTTRFARQAQSTFESSMGRVLKEQPLAVGIAGLAAGAALAAVFPATEMEKQAFAPAAEAVADVASQTGEQFRDAAKQVGDTLMAEADERGLNSDGLKDVAKEAAAAFTTTLSGKEKPRDHAKGGSSSSSAKPNAAGRSPSQDQRSSAGHDADKTNKR